MSMADLMASCMGNDAGIDPEKIKNGKRDGWWCPKGHFDLPYAGLWPCRDTFDEAELDTVNQGGTRCRRATAT